MRRIMIIPLVILIIAITSFPVSAITSDNDVYIDFYGRGVQSGAVTTFHPMSNITTGNLYYFRVLQSAVTEQWTGIDTQYTPVPLTKPTLSNFEIQLAFLVSADIYICLPFSVASSSFGSLGSYYDQDSSFGSYQSGSGYQLNIGTSTYSNYPYDTLTLDYSSDYPATMYWYFYKFNDVPAGSYVISIPMSLLFEYIVDYSVISPWYFGFGCIAEKLPDDSGSSSSTPIGGGSGGSGGGNTFLDPWFSSDADLTTNMESITDTLDAAIASAGTIFEQIFYAVYASYQLEQIVFVSDQHNVQQTKVFNTSLDNVISNFDSGATDYPTSLDQMSVNYKTALETAETPEQGNYITAVYQAKQQELLGKAMQDAGEKVKEVITDEDLNDLDEYTKLESELLDQLDIQQLEDTLDYKIWLNLLPYDEAMTYRTIFDFFVNDAVWRWWILIPFMFIIVSIILGTGVSMVGRSITINRMHAERSKNNRG